LQRVIRDLYELPEQPSPAQVEKLAQRWAGWRSYATFYLWLTYWEDRACKASLLERIRARKKRKSQ
jgi:3-methyladenine DNA glycosylase/8-oxoguanine DNA glycosylase